MSRAQILMLTILCFSVYNVRGQILKQMVVVSQSTSSSASSEDTLEIWKYNPKGQLIGQAYPLGGTGIGYAYDAQDRLIKVESFFTTYYHYAPLKNCKEEETANYHYQRCDSVDNQNRVKYTQYTRTDFPDHPLFSRITHRTLNKYWQQLLILRQWEQTTYKGTLGDSTTWTKPKKIGGAYFYHYDRQDSLVYELSLAKQSQDALLIKSLLKQMQDLRKPKQWEKLNQWIQQKIQKKVLRVYRHVTYQPNTHVKLTDTYYDNEGTVSTKTIYQYDSKARVVKESYQPYKSVLQRKQDITYFYNDQGNLSKEVITKSDGNQLVSRIEKKFKHNRLVIEIAAIFLQTKVLTFRKKYHYEFW